MVDWDDKDIISSNNSWLVSQSVVEVDPHALPMFYIVIVVILIKTNNVFQPSPPTTTI